VSHYCERAAWACDLKGFAYEQVALLPGLHLLSVRRLAPETHLPILVDQGRVIQDSGRIIEYLDGACPGEPLTPEDAEQRRAAEQWERELDGSLGAASRRVFYHHTLDRPDFLVAEYCRGAPFWARTVYPFMFPRVARVVRAKYGVEPGRVERDLEGMRAMFARLDRELAERPFLVGDRFTRADLTLASLIAPLIRPSGHPIEWADERSYPRSYVEATRPFGETLTAERVREWYRTRRPKKVARAARAAPSHS
jgi:glutathione S-transferase